MGWALVMTSPDEPWLPGPLFALLALLCGILGIMVSTLLVVMLTGTLVGLALLARAYREKEKPAVFLFGFFLFGVYVTGALWSRPEQTIALQRIAESAETLTWSAFAVGAGMLARTRIRKGPQGR